MSVSRAESALPGATASSSAASPTLVQNPLLAKLGAAEGASVPSPAPSAPSPTGGGGRGGRGG
eukprot:15380524-Alexandrium_andersonii.AAC.1